MLLTCFNIVCLWSIDWMSLKKQTYGRHPYFYSIIKFRKKNVWVYDARGWEESISKDPSPVRRCTLIFQYITMETRVDRGGFIPLRPRVDTPRGQLFWLMSSEAGPAFCTQLLIGTITSEQIKRKKVHSIIIILK